MMKKGLILAFMFSTSWAFGQTLNNTESVEYDPVFGRFLASNGSTVIEIDGDGNEVAYFGSDPESDYAMEVMNGYLFTIVGSHVMAFDLNGGAMAMDVTISGASFLNGMASDGVNRIWVTDFGSKKIHELNVADMQNVSTAVIVANTVTTPNGITYDGANNRLVFVNWGTAAPIKAVDLSDYSVSTLTSTTLGNCDGVDHDGDGNFYVSSWSPTRITRFSSEFAVNTIITAPGLSSPADICYAQEIDTLAIANSGNNTITFVGFAPTSVESVHSEMTMSCYPNPVSEQSVITFIPTHSGMHHLFITDMAGKLVATLMNENIPAVEQRVLLAGIELAPGSYIVSLVSAQDSISITITK